MKPKLITEIERIAGNRLSPRMREEIAERAIKIVEDHQRGVAITAMDTAKKTLLELSAEAATKEPKETI